jgi:hypothetical protein
MIVNLNMFSTFVKYIIMHNLNRTPIIVKYKKTRCMYEEHPYPVRANVSKMLIRDVGKDMIFSFNIKAGNNMLFLVTKR